MIRAKFSVHIVSKNSWGQEIVSLHAVHGDGKANESWSQATPNGTLTMTITNPEAQGKLVPGQEIYLDLSLA